jgi:hypothetical protein
MISPGFWNSKHFMIVGPTFFKFYFLPLGWFDPESLNEQPLIFAACDIPFIPNLFLYPDTIPHFIIVLTYYCLSMIIGSFFIYCFYGGELVPTNNLPLCWIRSSCSKLKPCSTSNTVTS